MGHDQIAFFKDRYARMSDEELAHLFVTRRNHLTEEAVSALQEVLAQKNITEFVREANEKVNDLNAQIAAASEELERQRETNRQIPRALAIVGIAAVIIFSASMLIRNLS